MTEKQLENSNIATFTLYVSKAVQDPDTGEMRWAATSSDTKPDLYDDEMTLELYRSFIERIRSNTKVPEIYRSEYWEGGMPYPSVSHYSDGNGKSVPGKVAEVYIDGNMLKAKGTFDDTPLGKACFHALRETVQRSQSGTTQQPVRVSIGFLDYAHVHKSTGKKFVRKNIEDICPDCLEMYLEEGKITGLRYLDGQLIHLALTRVPINPRTLMEIDKAMPTQMEDAASIVGKELAEEIDETENGLQNPQKAMVTKSEEEEAVPVLEEKSDTEVETPDPMKALYDRLDAIEKSLQEPAQVVVQEPVKTHPLDAVIAEFKSAFDEIDKTSADNIRELTPAWERFAETVKASFKNGVEGGGKEEKSDVAKLVKAEVQSAVQPLLDEIRTLKAEMAQPAPAPTETVQRGITSVPNLTVNEPAHARAQGKQEQSGTSIREIARRSVGLRQ